MSVVRLPRSLIISFYGSSMEQFLCEKRKLLRLLPFGIRKILLKSSLAMRQQMINSKLDASNINLYIVFRYTHNVSKYPTVLFIIFLFYTSRYAYLSSSNILNTKYTNVLHYYAYCNFTRFVVNLVLLIAILLCLGVSLDVIIGLLSLLRIVKHCIQTLTFCLLLFKCACGYSMFPVLYSINCSIILSGFTNYNVNNGKTSLVIFVYFCVDSCYNDWK